MGMANKYWLGAVPSLDDFGGPITDEFIDGKTHPQSYAGGSWALFNRESWVCYGYGKLGTGYGQRYKKQEDGRFLKVEG